MTKEHAAIVAAKNLPKWGAFAAARYALNRGATIPLILAARRFEERRAIRRRLNQSFAGWLAA